MNIKSLKTQFIGAIAMVLVAAIAMGSSTYAWFSMNTKVTVTGMQVTTTVNDNLLIADDTLDSTAKKADNLFVNFLNQTKTGILEPASTIDGKNFYYTATSNVKASGDAITDTYLSYSTTGLSAASNTTKWANAFSENYGVDKTAAANGALGYIDYVFQLKADTNKDSEIRLTGLDLIYNNGAADSSRAYRVAVFVEDITAGTASAAPGTLKKIYSQSDAVNFSSGEAVASTTALGTVSTANAVIAALDGSTTPVTGYYKVVVRLWLEGEDNTCNNATYMPLTAAWKLNLMIDIVDTDAASPAAAVSNISRTSTFTPNT